ncbi:MAG: hypothetical protein J0L81_04885 [Caulobacterales bacterium]|nr:hypothetical protein [Caulobacterales bacterium]
MDTKVNTKGAAAVLAGPGRAPNAAMRRVHVWAKAGLIPADRVGDGEKAGWEFERQTIAIAAVLFELYDRGGVRSHGMLRALFDKLASGEPALIDRIIEDAREGTPVLVLTHWGTADGRAATSFVVRLTSALDEPNLAPGDEWEPLLEGVLSLAPLFDKLIESSVVPFKAAR